MALSFNIVQWHAWAPGIADAQGWNKWARAPYIPADLALQPDVSFVPAMQRRRLTRMARMCFAAAWPLVGEGSSLPMVFGSRHGETAVSFQLLDAIARRDPLSPTQFGLSVHNAVGGQWSIQRGDQSEICAVAGQQDTLEHAFVEACGLMHAGRTDVMVLLSEDTPPPVYDSWIDDIAFPHAAAFRLSPGEDWSLEAGATADSAAHGRPPLGHTLNMLRSLLAGEAAWSHHCPPRSWMWRRSA